MRCLLSVADMRVFAQSDKNADTAGDFLNKELKAMAITCRIPGL